MTDRRLCSHLLEEDERIRKGLPAEWDGPLKGPRCGQPAKYMFEISFGFEGCFCEEHLVTSPGLKIFDKFTIGSVGSESECTGTMTTL